MDKFSCALKVIFFLVLFTSAGMGQEAAPAVSAEGQKEEPAAVTVPPAAEQGAAEQKQPGNDQEFNLKLRNLEEKINSLKDKVFRAKQRLAILQETVLSGALAGARCSALHLNEVGSAFDLISVLYYLDEAPIFKWVEGGPELKPELSVFDGSVVPGPHHLSVYLVFRGKGYGVFSYMEGYTFKLKAGYSFNVEEGQLVEVTATAKDRGSLVKLDNRLYISFDINKKVFEQKVEAAPIDTKEPSAE